MNAIVVIAHRRPEYLKKCLRAIQACRGLGEWLVTIQVDGLNKDPLVEECRRVARESDLMAALTRPGGNLGVNYNNFDAIGAAFSGYRPPEMVLVVEEDVILSLDALELCEWFYRHPERDNYACLAPARLQRQAAGPERHAGVHEVQPLGLGGHSRDVEAVV